MLFQFFFTYVTFFAVAYAVSVDEIVTEEWNLFKLQYNKNYDSFMEEQYRFEVFKENKFAINEHNKLFAEGKVAYEMELNHFADLMPEEISTGFNGNLNNSWIGDLDVSTFVSNPYILLPKNVDWRSRGAVTRVKSQGSCGSCWAFAATGALESHHFLKTHKLVSLSEQNLIDCSKQNHGCNGGWSAKAFEYVRKNRGIDTEAAYPYQGRDLKCRYNKKKIGATVSGIVTIPKGDERKLTEAVALKGPVAVAINSQDHGFHFYKRGIYDNPQCSKQSDHVVLIVGYGIENGHDYWLVKNSWSTHWGMNGYIKMARNKNLCGIANWGVYPLV